MLSKLLQYNHWTTSTDADGWRWYGDKDKPFSYPSVSTIQKAALPQPPELLDWYKKSTVSKIEKRLEETSAAGTELHSIFEEILQHGDSVALSKEQVDKYQVHVDSFREWVKKHSVQTIAQEFTVVNKHYGYAGRVDALAYVDGKVELLDWKTGAHYSDSWSSQTAAYQMAVCEMLGVPLDSIGCRVVQINRETGVLKDFKYQHVDFIQDTFLLALEMFKRAPRFNKLKKIGWEYITKKAMVRTPNV